jgi:hypothetical protein
MWSQPQPPADEAIVDPSAFSKWRPEMGFIVRFPTDAPPKPDYPEFEINRLTPENIALVNAVGTAIKQWLIDVPNPTREDIEWALSVVLDCLVTDEEGGA